MQLSSDIANSISMMVRRLCGRVDEATRRLISRIVSLADPERCTAWLTVPTRAWSAKAAKPSIHSSWFVKLIAVSRPVAITVEYCDL